MRDLRNFKDDFPEYYDMYAQKELGRIVVEVKDIIGGNEVAYQYYYENWTPKPHEKNLRYTSVTNFVKGRLNVARKQQKGNYKMPLDLGYIHLFKFFCKKSNKDVYYVCGDGHRRVSICHHYKVKRIYAEVTELNPKV